MKLQHGSIQNGISLTVVYTYSTIMDAQLGSKEERLVVCPTHP